MYVPWERHVNLVKHGGSYPILDESLCLTFSREMV